MTDVLQNRKDLVFEIINFLQINGNVGMIDNLKENVTKVFSEGTNAEIDELTEKYINWIRQLPAEKIKSFRQFLQRNLNVDFYDVSYYKNKHFSRILQNKKISNDDENLLATFFLANMPPADIEPIIAKSVSEYVKTYESKKIEKRKNRLTQSKANKILQEKILLDELINIIKRIKINDSASGKMAAYLQSLINQSYSFYDLKGLQSIKNDLIEMLKDVPSSEIQRLDEALIQKIGLSYSQIDGQSAKRIKTILKRGKINNDEEFRFIQSYLNELKDTSLPESDLNRMEELLIKYK